MVKAGALYYAIFLSFIISLMCGLLILGIWYHHKHTYSLMQNLRMERNVCSALTLALDTPAFIPAGQSKTIDVFNDSLSDVTLTKWFWGGYLLVKAETRWRYLTYTRIAMVGGDVLEGEPVALYLSDKERYLSLSGNTKLKGNCYLPKLGIRRAYIEGKSYTGDQLVDGVIKQSRRELPSLDPSAINNLTDLFKGYVLGRDSLGNLSVLTKADSVTNSFYNKTLVFYSDRWIDLSNIYIQGNIKIVSKQGITIENTVRANDVLWISPKIELGGNFTGNLQLFATDTIKIHDGVRLLFPSMIVLMGTNCKKPMVQIGNDCTLLGDVILLSKDAKQPGECFIGENTEIHGKIYCTGKVELRGIVHGSVYCDGIILHTPTSIYDNNLLDATIDQPSLSKYYASSVFFNDSIPNKQVKWEY
jgi:cytoskeletal protein CcmA (bactofilin family)